MKTVKLAILNDLGKSSKKAPRKFKVQANGIEAIEGYNGEIVTLDVWDDEIIYSSTEISHIKAYRQIKKKLEELA